jgi:Glycogen recognition site of AMP-activated protein kinase
VKDIDDDRPFPGLAALKDVTPPPSLVPAVMRRIAEPAPVTFWSWLRRPRRLELRLSPLGGLFALGATALAVFAVALGASTRAPVASLPPPTGGAVAEAEPEVVLVRFVIAAKGAKKVAVAGDFNAWNAGETVLVDADGQGTFVATVPLRKGSNYEYMFLVDGQWKTDPGAAEVRPDGFGRTNAILRL